MAHIVRPYIAPSISKHGYKITKDDKERKRRKLHFIVRRIVEGPDIEYDTSMDSDLQSSLASSEPIRSFSPALSTGSTIPSESSSVLSECERLVRKRVDRVPKRMSQLSVLPGMELVIPVKYNQKMARSFPGQNSRTEREQARRSRNTISARESRAKLRMMNELLHKEAAEAHRRNVELKFGLATTFCYAEELLHKLGLPMMDFFGMWKNAKESIGVLSLIHI